ncbi:hypothetical protein [Nitrospirillum sp. BR 11163]|uniref:hypothetical protein n=1 Tax=Nitrospirillum sp. BR 11163 TaxID=3104323 RepID=UPI002AFE1A4C|nr:hypothetical protein [Nitrospirillum sp. BR 11163]MEA1675471.1 hypothetical protein [Nitrospirillum sp. BR 11163]
MANAESFFENVKKTPDRFYIIHYSSQSLFDAGVNAHSPRITSIVVRHYTSGQTVSFSIHTIAEYLKIPPSQVDTQYDDVERELLTQFYNFARDRREKYWVHWNMRNVTFGFEHLEHRYRVLIGKEPPSIPIEVRINLNDVLKNRYGGDYAPDPKMLSLMEMNGGKVQGFLSGKEESEAFLAKDFIRMNTSTIAKVGFFSFVISSSIRGKLKTKGRGLLNFIDRLLESRKARLIAAVSAMIGLIVGLIQLIIWLVSLVPHTSGG